MFTNKTSWPIFGLAFVGLVIVSLTGLAFLVVFAVDGQAVSSWMQVYRSFREAWTDSSGDEFTGEMTADKRIAFQVEGCPGKIS